MTELLSSHAGSSASIENIQSSISALGQQMLDKGVKPAEIDKGYLERTDSYWEQEVTKRPGLDTQEILNYGLFNPAWYDAIENIGITIPWDLTPEQEADPKVKAILEKIDKHIAFIDGAIRAIDSKYVPGTVEYDSRMAQALFYFCMADTKSKWLKNGYYSQIMALGIGEEGEHDYTKFLGKDNGIDMLNIADDAPGEGTIYNVLTNGQGWCTEQAYTYFFIARRAGLNVSFAEASVGAGGNCNHMFNVVYLKGGKAITIDLAQQEINKKYEFWVPIDPYQALAVYYNNSIVDEDNLDEATIALAIDPSGPQANNNYANAINDDSKKVDEALHHYRIAYDHGGETTTFLWGIAAFLENHTEKEDATPYWKSCYAQSKINYERATDTDEKRHIRETLAVSAFEAGHLDEAQMHFDGLLTDSAFKADAHFMDDYADFCVAKGNPELAKQVYMDLISNGEELPVDIIPNFLNLMQKHFAANEEWALQYVIRYHPEDARTLRKLGHYWFDKQDYVKAMGFYQQSYSIDPDPITQQNIDACKTNIANHEERLAQAAVPVVTASNPFQPMIDAYNNGNNAEAARLAKALKAEGRAEENIDIVLKTSLWNLFVSAYNSKKYPEAIIFIKDYASYYGVEAIESPKLEHVLVAYQLSGDYPHALGIAEILITRQDYPKDKAYDLKGSVCLDAKDYEQALGAYENAIQYQPSEARYHYQKAVCLQQLKRDDEFDASFDEACRLKPDISQSCPK